MCLKEYATYLEAELGQPILHHNALFTEYLF